MFTGLISCRMTKSLQVFWVSGKRVSGEYWYSWQSMNCQTRSRDMTTTCPLPWPARDGIYLCHTPQYLGYINIMSISVHSLRCSSKYWPEDQNPPHYMRGRWVGVVLSEVPCVASALSALRLSIKCNRHATSPDHQAAQSPARPLSTRTTRTPVDRITRNILTETKYFDIC